MESRLPWKTTKRMENRTIATTEAMAMARFLKLMSTSFSAGGRLRSK
jgi:hypothetical protein